MVRKLRALGRKGLNPFGVVRSLVKGEAPLRPPTPRLGARSTRILRCDKLKGYCACPHAQVPYHPRLGVWSTFHRVRSYCDQNVNAMGGT